jgi:hypothetical protein
MWLDLITNKTLLVDRPQGPSSTHSKDSDINDLRRQVRDITIDNDLVHKKFGEIDVRMDKMDHQMGEMNHNINRLNHKVDALSEQLAMLLARNEPSQTPPAYTPPTSSQAKQSQIRPPSGFDNLDYDMGRGLEPGHHTDSKSVFLNQPDRDYSNPCSVDMLTCGNFQQMDGSTQQQQIEIGRMLAIITSCCPENDTYNAESFIKQKTHFQDQDDSKPDVRHKKIKIAKTTTYIGL